MSCPRCGVSRFLTEPGICAACIRDEEARHRLLFGIGGVQFLQHSATSMTLLYHDCYGHVTFALPLERG